MGAALSRTLDEQDAVLLGRVRFTERAGCWPTSTDEPFASWINSTRKYVASSTLDSVDLWSNSTLIKGSLADFIAELREQPGGTLRAGRSPRNQQRRGDRDLPPDPIAVPALSSAHRGRLVLVIDEFAKEYLHGDLREIRAEMVWKLDGLSEYDIRRPLTATGTNLLGLIKHLATWEARYLGEVFDRPFPEPLPRWDDAAARGADLWATADETREEIIARYQRVWEHADATINALDIDAPGYVPWWPRPNVKLFNILVHRLTETNRHAGHADILREQLDGKTGASQERDAAFWADRCAKIERAAQAAASPR